jgi:transcriptional regulator with XRE-family HTH domain
MASSLVREVRTQRPLPSRALARAIREAAGVSQARLAAELGVDRVTVARWELGIRRPRGKRAAVYATLLAQLQEAVER